MFFEKIRLKVNSILQGGPRPQRVPHEAQPTRDAIERVLLAEYDKAQTEFDRAKEDSSDVPNIQACGQRYIEATVRLRKFLTGGEVPRDVLDKLQAELQD
jgi:hypothetical protein